MMSQFGNGLKDMGTFYKVATRERSNAIVHIKVLVRHLNVILKRCFIETFNCGMAPGATQLHGPCFTYVLVGAS